MISPREALFPKQFSFISIHKERADISDVCPLYILSFSADLKSDIDHYLGSVSLVARQIQAAAHKLHNSL